VGGMARPRVHIEGFASNNLEQYEHSGQNAAKQTQIFLKNIFRLLMKVCSKKLQLFCLEMLKRPKLAKLLILSIFLSYYINFPLEF
jgi:hypothetical protein